MSAGCRLLLSLFLFIFGVPLALLGEKESKTRVVVLTDIEADPDDHQSLIRLLLYSNQLKVEGLIATTSIHQKNRVSPESIHEVLMAYQKVQPNLLRHESGFPSYAYLKSKVKSGLAVYGMEGVGPGRDSEGSEWIIRVLEKPDPGPVWFSVWGGPNCLAQALWKIRNTRKPEEAVKLYDKIRIYTISDQDDSGPWIRNEFKNLFFIVSPGYNYSNASWTGITRVYPGSEAVTTNRQWLAEHIQQGHGPLGAAYPDVAYGMEGDTPAFLGLLPNGLNDPEQPAFGGWGGRYELKIPVFRDSNSGPFRRENWPQDQPETRPIWTNAADSVYAPSEQKGYKSDQATIWRWRTEFQHDFAARMDWCFKPFHQANHPPRPALAHADRLTVKSGELFHLNAKGTEDPDGDSMSFLWFQYKEAGTFDGYIPFRPYSPNLYDLPVKAPDVTSPQTVHFILKVTDKGSPALTRYKRVIVTINP
ncbi:MAG TPA: DUF1593 domain-containing protein [Saprospiraceae bacterium]|nr:DUF1593 domain-containing protein [Saprospiraceae bacterium]HNT22261.1 DUF1593 domain-containing protein [Saprospiraceae bacterium]